MSPAALQNNNTLHFVRIDTDASDPSSSTGWTVGGVAWGNTDAFRAAVQANWKTAIYNDRTWAKAQVFGTLGQTAPWDRRDEIPVATAIEGEEGVAPIVDKSIVARPKTRWDRDRQDDRTTREHHQNRNQARNENRNQARRRIQRARLRQAHRERTLRAG